MNAKIALSDVHKSFGPKDVLRGVDLEVENGSIGCRHWRLGQRQIGDAEIHSRPTDTR